MRVEPDGIILIIAAIGADYEDEFQRLSGKTAQVKVNRIVFALVCLCPTGERPHLTVVAVIQFEDHVTLCCIVLAIDNGTEAVTSLYCKSWELATDEPVIFILRDGQQPRLVLRYAVFHLRVV